MERHFVGATGSDFALTFVQRFELAGRALWFYAAEVVWRFESDVHLIRTGPSTRASGGSGCSLCRSSHCSAPWRLWPVAIAPLSPLRFSLPGTAGFQRRWASLNVYPFHGYSYVAIWITSSTSPARQDHRVLPRLTWLLSGVEKGAGIGIAAMLVAGLGVLTWRQAHMYTDTARSLLHYAAA